MGAITLQSRQSLSRRIHAFGGLNNRGTNRRVQFGSSRTTAEVDAAWALLRTPYHQERMVAELEAWNKSHPGERMLDPDWWYLENHSEMFNVSTAPVPVSTPPSDPVPPVVIPSGPGPAMTQAQYEAALAEAQVEAAKLAALAASKQAANAADSARIKAEDALAARNAEIALQTEAAPEPKSNALPWLIAAGVALLVLKG